MSRIFPLFWLVLTACAGGQIYEPEPCESDEIGRQGCSEGLGHILECRSSGFWESAGVCGATTICSATTWPLECESPCVLSGTRNGMGCWGGVLAECSNSVAETIEICEDDCDQGACQ